jgi:hypothetical protein
VSQQRKGIGDIALEIKDLTIAYVKQETVDPLKLLGRYIALGLAGSFLIGIGVILLTFAGVRALQTETGTALTGNWSWVPYLAAIVFLAAVIGIFARVISRQPKRTNR